jgi:hypothetical protein
MKCSALGLIAVLLPVVSNVQAAGLTYKQLTDPCIAFEGTTNNHCLITLTNTDPDNIATITNVSSPVRFLPLAGESDDKATNPALVGVVPTVQDPLLIAANGGTANIAILWDAVDNIVDNDVDYGDWFTGVTISYHYAGGPNDSLIAFADVRVKDPPRSTPEPASFILIGAGLIVLGAYRFRAATNTTIAQPTKLIAKPI